MPAATEVIIVRTRFYLLANGDRFISARGAVTTWIRWNQAYAVPANAPESEWSDRAVRFNPNKGVLRLVRKDTR